MAGIWVGVRARPLQYATAILFRVSSLEGVKIMINLVNLLINPLGPRRHFLIIYDPADVFHFNLHWSRTRPAAAVHARARPAVAARSVFRLATK